MGGWDIADSAPETEKLKAEMNDLLMRLNSCTDIDILTYDKLYTFLIDELFDEVYKLGAVEDKVYLDKEKMENKVGVFLDELDYYNKITKSGYNTLYNFTMEWINKIYKLADEEN